MQDMGGGIQASPDRAPAWGRLVRLALLTAIVAGSFPNLGIADEVDDILALKAKNANRLKHFSAEYTVRTTQPSSVKNPKTLTMRYRMKLERIPKDKLKTPHNPWRIETEVLEPLPMKLKVEGEQAWYLDQQGEWVELVMTPEVREQFLGMAERYRGTEPSEQRKRFDIKVLRHNNPIFGPRTRTVEFRPKGSSKLYARMEEDVDGNGLPLETRLYDDAGKQTLVVQVKRHHKDHDIPVLDEVYTEAEGPAGIVRTSIVSSGAAVEIGE
jgi:hypothetical protein